MVLTGWLIDKSAYTRLSITPDASQAPAIPDLLVAATAEIAGLTVLARDKDFDLIANITGQSVEAIRG